LKSVFIAKAETIMCHFGRFCLTKCHASVTLDLIHASHFVGSVLICARRRTPASVLTE